MLNPEEARWLMDVQKLIQKGNNKCQQLDLLEVYAYPNSQLTEVAQACGLKAKRFTFEDGDLQTSEGRTNLLFTLLLHQPKHVWLSPECRPWSPWNRFNASRSIQCFRNCPTCCDGRLRPSWINVCLASNIRTPRIPCRSERESKQLPVKCLPCWMIDCVANNILIIK